MTTSDERLRVLQMLEDGKISAEDAATLLRALDGGRAATSTGAGSGGAGSGRRLRVQVSDLDSGATKVNMTVPFAMVSAGLRIAERFAPEFSGIDMEELEGMIASGDIGKIVEVVDAEDREKVEVFVE